MRLSRLIRAKQSTDPGEIVQLIDRAIFNGRKIIIQYEPLSPNYPSEERRITPIAWRVTKEGLILVVAYNNWGETRTYRLDHISKVQETWTDGREGPYDNMYDYLNNSDD